MSAPITPRPEDPIVTSARREALVVFAIWLAAMAYTLVVCTVYGYNRVPDDLTYVWGFPDWVFWGVVAPWVACWLMSLWFSFSYMSDAELGIEIDEEEDFLATPEATDE